jgi:hypothetical protein
MCTCNKPGFNAQMLRRETLNGVEYLVAPFVSLVEGVLHGSQGELFYPRDEIERLPGIWNHVPLVLDHPIGMSARRPDVLENMGLGFVFNDKVEDGKRKGEAWFDVNKTKNLSPGVYSKLVSGQPIELSTGLYTSNEPTSGTHNGVSYTAIARNYIPDHLAVFEPGTDKGACSVVAGCGVNVNATPQQKQQPPAPAPRPIPVPKPESIYGVLPDAVRNENARAYEAYQQASLVLPLPQMFGRPKSPKPVYNQFTDPKDMRLGLPVMNWDESTGITELVSDEYGDEADQTPVGNTSNTSQDILPLPSAPW